MIGSRATSGSVATRLRNVVIACGAVEQVGVHVDVEHVRAAAHLLERDLERLLVLAALDEAAEARRARDVRALADHHEVRVGRDRERLEAAEARHRLAAAGTARGGTPSTAAAIART